MKVVGTEDRQKKKKYIITVIINESSGDDCAIRLDKVCITYIYTIYPICVKRSFWGYCARVSHMDSTTPYTYDNNNILYKYSNDVYYYKYRQSKRSNLT